MRDGRLMECQNPARGRSEARGRWLRACPRHGRLVRRQRARCRVVLFGDEGGGVLVRERVRRPSGGVPPVRDQRDRPRAWPERRLSRRVEPGGVPRSRGRVQAARRGRGATPWSLGLLPLASVDGARLRGSWRQAMRDPDGRRTRKPGGALPSVGTRGALWRERGEGDIRSRAGLCDGRKVPARAAAVLVPPALGLEPFAVALRGHSGVPAQGTAATTSPRVALITPSRQRVPTRETPRTTRGQGRRRVPGARPPYPAVPGRAQR